MATVLPNQTAVPAQPVPASHPFTCNTCQVAFRSSEAQRTHMRSDWHRYNLKRRVASLPPLSSEVFAEKVLTAQATSSAAAAKASFEKSCSVCQKTYYSENSYQNHLNSQKHKQNLALSNKGTEAETRSLMSSTFSLGEPIETSPSTMVDPAAEEEFSKIVNGMEEASLEEKSPVSRRPSRPHHSAENEIISPHPLSATSTEQSTPSVASESTNKPENSDHSLSRCLFCNYDSPTWKFSVMHMEKFHGMFIPEQAYLTDIEGLICHLHDKITKDHECLLCHKIKGSTFGIQTHMRDKGHCMIAFSTEEEMIEIGQFYDFSSTYSEAGDDDTSSDTSMADGTSGVKLPSHPKYKTQILNADGNLQEMSDNESEHGEGWETDSDASSLDSAELTSVPVDDHSHQYSKLPLHRHHSHTDPRPHKSVDGFHAHIHHPNHAAFYSDYELHLPNGRTLGHRSLARYYRQNLHNYPTPEERESRRAITSGENDASDDDAMDEDINPALTEANDLSKRENQLIKRHGTRNLGMIGASVAQRAVVKKAEKRDRKAEERARRRYEWGNEKRANSQKHFRDPLLQ